MEYLNKSNAVLHSTVMLKPADKMAHNSSLNKKPDLSKIKFRRAREQCNRNVKFKQFFSLLRTRTAIKMRNYRVYGCVLSGESGKARQGAVRSGTEDTEVQRNGQLL